ncbi:hypothetical protein ACHQM5_007272 [Ranunculus cassubicifolius]
MATAPVKSQPLHNFSLPHLKWGKNQTSNQRCRKLNESSRDSTCIDHHLHNQNNRSSASEAESDGGSSSHHQDTVNQRNSVGSTRTGKNRFLASGSSSVVVKTESRCDDGKSNLVIRISKGESVVSKNKSGSGNGGSGGEAEGDGGKPWNLRPRRSIGKTNNNDHNHGGGGAMKNGGELEEMIQPKSLRLRGLLVETENVEKKEKLKFSIPLARDEIEEDFFAWTGSKPPRRPKKRNRSIQKQLDNTFPGLWLAGITADCYNVPEVTSKIFLSPNARPSFR